jgi:nitroimidazol reductase NimA-like FMN-containing flavoprotein (pyridoxamine 5'-phosphate oxidase superfamily)
MTGPGVDRPGDDRDADGPTTWFSALSRSQCEELLAEHDVGRIAWRASTGLQLLPVSYMWREGDIVFRTSPHGVLAELIEPSDVVFGVDMLDQHAHTGWSVVVNGRAEGVSSPDDLSRLRSTEGPVPWAAGGVRNFYVRITPEQITGRSVIRKS